MNFSRLKYYLIPLAVCVAGVCGIFVYYFHTGFSTVEKTQYVYIDGDDTIDSVAAKMKPFASGHALTALTTALRHSSYASHVYTGRYAVNPGDDVKTVFQRLRNGQQAPVRLVVAEPRTMDRMAALLASKLMADSMEIVSLLTDDAFCQSLGYDTANIACIFVPNTYEVYWNISPKRLMERMKKEHDRFWTAERREQAKAHGLSPNEVCTLASIVDEETAARAEKPIVAGLYLNRLKKGMMLQADPTVKFALKDFALRRVLNRHLEAESPYNTYKNFGLPPGPIKVASVDGILAVLSAAEHDYIYMCAKEDFSGTHNFARTLAEHNRNAAKYANALNQRGIK